VRQQGRERGEEGDVERHDRAQDYDQAAHSATVASGFAPQLVANGTRFH